MQNTAKYFKLHAVCVRFSSGTNSDEFPVEAQLAIIGTVITHPHTLTLDSDTFVQRDTCQFVHTHTQTARCCVCSNSLHDIPGSNEITHPMIYTSNALQQSHCRWLCSRGWHMYAHTQTQTRATMNYDLFIIPLGSVLPCSPVLSSRIGGEWSGGGGRFDVSGVGECEC